MEHLEDRKLLSVVSLTPVKDNSLVEYKAGTQSSGAGSSLFVGLDHWTQSRMRGVMAFDVAGNVPSGANINSVTLSVWVNLTASTTSVIPSVELHKTSADWGEGTSTPTGFMPPFANATPGDATWLHTFYDNQFWATPGGDFSSTVSGVTTFGADNTSATWNSTSQMVADVQSWLDNPSTNFGWLLKGDETQESGKMIDSRESATAAHRPTLTIDYTVPPPAPTLAIAAAAADKLEGDSGTTPFTFTVTRTGNSSGTSSAAYAVTGSGANPADTADFAGSALPSGTVTFAAGETSKTFTISVSGDTNVEPDEGFTVTLSGPVGATISTASATGTIRNDDVAAPTLAIAAASADKVEGNSGSTAFTFTVARSGDTSGTSSADYSVSGSGANPADAADFTGGALPSGTVNFAAGEASKTITVNVSGDTTVEPDEGFTISLANPGGATITTASAGAMIRNDDSVSAPTLAIAAAAADKAEGNSGSTPFTFTITRSGDTSGTSSAEYSVNGSGTNPADAGDFAGSLLPSGTVSFAASETSKTITVNVNGDTDVEPDEGFTVTLANPVGAAIATGSATGTIRNDDSLPAPTLAIAAAAADKAEGNSGSTPFTFTVTRSGDTSGSSSADFSVTGSGATPADAADFAGGVLPGGTVTFAAGEASKTITINVNGDTSVEPDEGFTVTLANPVGATLATPSADGTIVNDDTSTNPVLSIDDVQVLEGDSGITQFVFTVTLNGKAGGPVTVDFATADGTATAGRGRQDDDPDNEHENEHREEGDDDRSESDDRSENSDRSSNDDGSENHDRSEDNRHSDSDNSENHDSIDDGSHGSQDGDYMATSGTLTFAGNDGETKTIVVSVYGDTQIEPDETFFVNLSNPVGATLARNQGIGTILDDDSPAQNLGHVDHRELEHEDPSHQELWYQMSTTHPGLLTVNAIPSEPSQAVGLALYDHPQDDGPALDSDQGIGERRIDHLVNAADEVYYLKLSGDSTNVNLQLVNLVEPGSGRVVVHGTDSADNFEFDARQSRRITVNGTGYDFTPEEAADVQFDGGPGIDTISMRGAAGDEQIDIEPGHGTYTNAEASLTAELNSFENMLLYASPQGNDSASLHDSAGNDQFKSEPASHVAKLMGRKLHTRIKFFDSVDVYSSGGNDYARFFDTGGDDTFQGQMSTSQMSGSDYEVRAHDFERVLSVARYGGTDTTTLVDSALRDEFHGKPHKAEIFDLATHGDVYRITARQFDDVHAVADNHAGVGQDGGVDKAKLWGTVADDRVEATQDELHYSQQSGDQMKEMYSLLGFEWASVRQTPGGKDTKDVSDTLQFDLAFDQGWESD